jgi:Spy/CpxP family protein refolding chaperone
MIRYARCLGILSALTAGLAFAQPPQAPTAPMAPQSPAAPPAPGAPPPPPRASRPPIERAFQAGPPGRWWTNPEVARKLALTADQQKRMDETFQQHRLKLIDLHASLQREEAVMEPMVEADQPDQPKLLAQIDKVAEARAELEKANARMLLAIRMVLTPEQWKKLDADGPARGSGPDGHMGPHGRAPMPPPPPATGPGGGGEPQEER